MEITYYILGALLLLLALLPLVPHPHWVFRTPEFGRIQALGLQAATLLFGFIAVPHGTTFWILQSFLLLLAAHNAWVLLPYTRVYSSGGRKQFSRKGPASPCFR